jgi:hypothetical protein
VRSVALVLREMKEELFTVAFDGTFVSFLEMVRIPASVFLGIGFWIQSSSLKLL